MQSVIDKFSASENCEPPEIVFDVIGKNATEDLKCDITANGAKEEITITLLRYITSK